MIQIKAVVNPINFILFLLVVAVILIGCAGNETQLIDGDQHITLEMDEVISNYIIQVYSSSNNDIEKQFEVHRIYGTSEVDGVLSVYMWSYYGGFNKSTGVENQIGHSLPAVIRLKKEEEGSYSVIEYIEPQDGNLYLSSLQKMFPNKYLKLVKQDSGNIEDLKQKMDKKVEQWLEEKDHIS
ncbi:hypothetical protein [Caldalkalibacillus mannanilyticus]|uniref:hypothetical protein n=1 Tax=Caldalkalibacillus mannanilyticus TaxID=1418 RepID=UPI000468F8A7|nr:hypothetical protein [Caldalkalibacillus mannanilyticus]